MSSSSKLSDAIVRTMQRLRDQHGDMTLFQAQFFVVIAANPGINLKDVYRQIGANDSMASRTMALLTDIGSRTIPGLDLVVARVNSLDRRERLLDLTPKGKRLWADIEKDFSRL